VSKFDLYGYYDIPVIPNNPNNIIGCIAHSEEKNEMMQEIKEQSIK
jgi:hypothetical protein